MRLSLMLICLVNDENMTLHHEYSMQRKKQYLILAAFLQSLIIAGTETSATTLEWAMTLCQEKSGG